MGPRRSDLVEAAGDRLNAGVDGTVWLGDGRRFDKRDAMNLTHEPAANSTGVPAVWPHGSLVRNVRLGPVLAEDLLASDFGHCRHLPQVAASGLRTVDLPHGQRSASRTDVPLEI